ncbi:hypothetical protein [Mesoterricola silvestris]|uniref:DUF4382 domain-containing protein n=1 Tax=Mesoterricola silvestris TaxID=2927979 RepID=A0AA48GZ57_9BACT|nr:hypothetical protein [Mesoterricola silvestris]BDU74521.1 hypothetical protein METEAL_36950 [Mesoterricola silvestris]
MVLLSKWRLLAGALLALLAFSCSSSRLHTPEGSLRVRNDGSVSMTQLYITPSTSSTWGAEQLGNTPLAPADSLTFIGLDPGYYDVRARFSDGTSDTVFDNQVLDGGTTVLGLLNSGTGAVAVFNNTAFPITGIYLTPSSSDTWGPNQTDAPLGAGQSLTLTGVSPGTYDLKVIFSTSTSSEYKAFTVTAGGTVTLQVN